MELEKKAQAKKHSLYGGSGRKRWSNCVPSVKISIPYMVEEEHVLTPQEIVMAIYEDRLVNSPVRISAAFEGSLGHAVQELALLKKLELAKLRGKKPHLLSGSLLDCIDLVVKKVLELAKEDPRTTILVEPEFQIAEDAWGSADIVLIQPTLRRFYVIDTKTGKGQLEEAQDNEQLLYYAVGVLDLIDGYDVPISDWEWHLVIAQPRLPDTDGNWWRVEEKPRTTRQIMDEKRLIKQQIAAAKIGEGPFNPGSWCRYCPGAVACPAQQASAEEAVRNEFLPVTAPADAPAIFGLTLGQLLRKLEALEEWGKRVREYAYQLAEAGDAPDTWKLVEKRATRKFKDEVKDILPDALRSGLGLPDEIIFKEREVRSVNQIEEHAKAAGILLDKEKFRQLYEAKSSGYNLVREEERGQPVTRGNPSDEFAASHQLTEEELASI